MNLTEETKILGEQYIKMVRDDTIKTLEMDVERGETYGGLSKLYNVCDLNNEKFKSIIKASVIEYLDAALMSIFELLEENSTTIKLAVDSGSGFKDVVELSDGLGGDYIDWIDQYSKYPKANWLKTLEE